MNKNDILVFMYFYQKIIREDFFQILLKEGRLICTINMFLYIYEFSSIIIWVLAVQGSYLFVAHG